MTYTINGKQYTRIEIDKLCAKLMGIQIEEEIYLDLNACWTVPINDGTRVNYMPTLEANHVWAIIEKCWDELTKVHATSLCSYTTWEDIMHKNECTKLIAACICFIEINEGKL